MNNLQLQIPYYVLSVRLFAAAAVLCSLVQSSEAQSESPKWNLKTGDQFVVSISQTSKSETKLDSRETILNNETVIEMDWNVTDVAADGVATIEQSLSRVMLSVTGFARKKKGDPATPLKDIKFDTATPDGLTKDSKALFKQINPLIGLKFTVVMSPYGEVKDLSVSKEVQTQLNKMPDARNLRRLFAAAGWKDILGASAMVLPKGISAGESWADDQPSELPFGKFNRKRKYTFVGEEDVESQSTWMFNLDVTLDPIEAEGADESDLLKSKLVEFTGSGELGMNVEGGHLSYSNVKNRAHSTKPYREKVIETIITNEINTLVTKK